VCQQWRCDFNLAQHNHVYVWNSHHSPVLVWYTVNKTFGTPRQLPLPKNQISACYRFNLNN
jgi:hypothetical protein